MLSGTFLPLVLTGLHQGLVPIHVELVQAHGYNALLPILSMAGMGQVGAAIAILMKTRNDRLKKVIKGALPVGLLGIGEPLIFGVTLPLGKPSRGLSGRSDGRGVDQLLESGYRYYFRDFRFTAGINHRDRKSHALSVRLFGSDYRRVLVYLAVRIPRSRGVRFG